MPTVMKMCPHGISEHNSPPTRTRFWDSGGGGRYAQVHSVMGDDELYNDLLNDFLELEDELNALKQAIDNRDFPSIARNAHIFRTALRYIGAYTLAELASSIELTIKRSEHKTAGSFSVNSESLHVALGELREKVKGMINTKL